jgi:hypothetical protein
LGQIDTNLKDIQYRHRDQLRSIDKRLKEKLNKAEEAREGLREDLLTKKELNSLRKADQEENYMRTLNLQNI